MSNNYLHSSSFETVQGLWGGVTFEEADAEPALLVLGNVDSCSRSDKDTRLTILARLIL